MKPILLILLILLIRMKFNGIKKDPLLKATLVMQIYMFIEDEWRNHESLPAVMQLASGSLPLTKGRSSNPRGVAFARLTRGRVCGGGLVRPGFTLSVAGCTVVPESPKKKKKFEEIMKLHLMP